MKRPSLRPVALVLALATNTCFSVEHRLPRHAYFGQLPLEPHDRARAVEHEAMKNWFLAGLFPWTRFNDDDLVRTGGPVRRIDSVELETRFSGIDTLIWVIPGQVYGYYFWAPRTLRVRGRELVSE